MRYTRDDIKRSADLAWPPMPARRRRGARPEACGEQDEDGPGVGVSPLPGEDRAEALGDPEQHLEGCRHGERRPRVGWAKTPQATRAQRTARTTEISTPRWPARLDRPFMIETIQPGWPSVTEKAQRSRQVNGYPGGAGSS